MHITITLPPSYRSADIVAFHRRDTEGVAERVDGKRLRKGVMLGGVPVLIDITLEARRATCTITADGIVSPAAQQLANDALLNMLGLRIDPAPFLEAVRHDALLGPLTRRQGPLRIVQSATVFEALTWAIIGQQINLPFAIALRRTFIEQAGQVHSSALWCYPEAPDVARLSADALTTRKFSRSKAETLLRVARLIDDGALELAPAGDVEAISASLLAVKGIGPWTVNYALLRGYGYADCSLHGDVAIRTAFQRLLGEDSKPDMPRTEQLLARYRPHRTMAAAHLWASLNAGCAAND